MILTLRELDDRWELRIDSLAAGMTGVAKLGDNEIRISVKDCISEVERLGVDRQLEDFDTCIRFDCWPDMDGPTALVQAITTLALLTSGLTFNPLQEEAFIDSEEIMVWCERCMAALGRIPKPKSWPGSQHITD